MAEPLPIYTGPSSFWKTYLRGRPHIPDTFFTRIYSHHSTHGNGSFGTAHDAGAGAGIHSARLAQRFPTVIVTDVSASNIATAESQLASLPPGSKFHFHVSKLEDSSPGVIEAGSVDFVFAGSVLHFTDTEAALRAVAHQLKPGGTFAATCVGGLWLSDPGAQEALEAVFHAGCRQAIATYGRGMLEGTLCCNALGYDGVAFPPELFEPGSVRRWKINDDRKDFAGGRYYEMIMPPELRKELPPVSRIGEGEKVEFEWDKALDFKKDIAGLKEVLDTFPFDYEAEEMKAPVRQLESVVGGREVDGHWLITTIIATKRRD